MLSRSPGGGVAKRNPVLESGPVFGTDSGACNTANISGGDWRQGVGLEALVRGTAKGRLLEAPPSNPARKLSTRPTICILPLLKDRRGDEEDLTTSRRRKQLISNLVELTGRPPMEGLSEFMAVLNKDTLS
jgi:hypothetical protein